MGSETRILPRTAFCFHDPKPGGATVWLRDLVRALPGARDGLLLFPAPSPLVEELTAEGFSCRVLDGLMGSLTAAGILDRLQMGLNRVQLVAAYRRLYIEEAIEAVYVNSSVQIAPMIGATLARRPLLVHVHEGPWQRNRTFFLRRACVRNLARAALFAAQSTVPLYGQQPRGRRWEFSPNGVRPELAHLRENREPIRQSLGLKPSQPMALYLGTLSKLKGAQDLAPAWARVCSVIPEARLYIAGGIDEAAPESIRRLVEAPGEGITFLGFRRDAHDLIAAADFLVLPSYGEAMPISISEAMMIGTPVVARLVGDIGWQIGEGRGFPFSGAGPESFARSMIEALADPAEAQRRAAAAQEFAKTRLCDSTQVDQVATALRWIAKPS